MSDLSEEPNFVNRELQIQQNWSRLQSYLMSVGHNLCLQNEPRQFSAGFGNLNYLVNFDGASAVLRRPPMGPLQPGTNDMLREGKILRSLSCPPHFLCAHSRCGRESLAYRCSQSYP